MLQYDAADDADDNDNNNHHHYHPRHAYFRQHRSVAIELHRLQRTKA